MTKAKNVYTIIRYWEEDGLTGLDILGSTREFNIAVKIVEDMAENKPYPDWEGHDYDQYDLDRIVIEPLDIDDEDICPLLVTDLYTSTTIEASCKYKIGDTSLWTYAYFYVVESEMLKAPEES